jgi:hypothetical protein
LAEAQKRVKKIKKFYKDLYSFLGVSIVLIGINLFFSGNIGWAKYPVFFWGIFIVADAFNIFRLQRFDKTWELRQMEKFTGRRLQSLPAEKKDADTNQVPIDYSDELLHQPSPEREAMDLKEVRNVQKTWRDEDFV